MRGEPALDMQTLFLLSAFVVIFSAALLLWFEIAERATPFEAKT
jgi:hypothetical protein